MHFVQGAYLVFLNCILCSIAESTLNLFIVNELTQAPVKSSIVLEQGQSIVLKCGVNCTSCPHDAVTKWSRSTTSTNFILQLHNVTEQDEGECVCECPQLNLSKSIQLIINRRRKRGTFPNSSDGYFQDQIFKMQRDYLDKKVDWFSHFNNEDLYNKHRKFDEDWTTYFIKPTRDDKPTPVKSKNKGLIGIIIVIIIAFILLLFLIITCNRFNKKPSTMNTNRTSQGLTEPVANPLPRERLTTNHRTVTTSITMPPPDPDPKLLPPPTYEEAMRNFPPSMLSVNYFGPSVPRM
ncbi:hypothetical protein FQA39_LY18212 [Lamprigera yunnana]|nr:hypothetical protein FQA39_LY18212 [Lamprigera yunnana]